MRAIKEVVHEIHGQSWDRLAGGKTTGNAALSHPMWARIWRWPNFAPQELACKGTGALMLYEPALDALQALREDLGRPLTINSAYRSPEHNRNIKGSKRSRHMSGAAFDVACRRSWQNRLIDRAKAHGFNGIGRYETFVHIDFRARPAAWGG